MSKMCKHDVVKHETGSSQRIATLSEQERATAIGNVHRKFDEARMCADKHTDRHAHRNTPLPYIGSGVTSERASLNIVSRNAI